MLVICGDVIFVAFDEAFIADEFNARVKWCSSDTPNSRCVNSV